MSGCLKVEATVIRRSSCKTLFHAAGPVTANEQKP